MENDDGGPDIKSFGDTVPGGTGAKDVVIYAAKLSGSGEAIIDEIGEVKSSSRGLCVGRSKRSSEKSVKGKEQPLASVLGTDSVAHAAGCRWSE